VKLTILWPGKTKDRRLAVMIEEYLGKIRRYCKLEIVEIREEGRRSGAPARVRIEKEGKKILKAFRPGETRIVLDERGTEMTSEEFAALLGRALESAPAGVKLIVGGPYGLSSEVKSESEHRWALSRMTLTHETARLVVLDQVYRAFTIMKGEPYHH